MDLEAYKVTVENDLRKLKGECSERSDQLTALIADIKRKNAELERISKAGNKELEREYAQRSKELATQYGEAQTTYLALLDDLKKVQSEVDIATEEREAIKVETIELSNQTTELTENYTHLLEQVKYLEYQNDSTSQVIESLSERKAELAAEVATASSKHDDIIADLDKTLAEYKVMVATKKKEADQELTLVQEAADRVSREIVDLKKADAQWVKNLREDEFALTIKRKALIRDRDEFEMEKRRFFASNRVI